MSPTRAATEAGHLEFRMGRTAQMLKGLRRVRGAMVRVQVIAYTPTDVIEEADVTVGLCRELLEKYAVTWVNVVDPDTRTLGTGDALRLPSAHDGRRPEPRP